MDLSKYLEKWVKIDLKNGFYYEGLVIGIDKDSISIKDKKGIFVDISVDTISFIREVDVRE
jgi:hypothetical protein